MSLESETAKVQAALSLLTSEQADAIIGEQTPEYRKLIRGGEALAAMVWALVQSGGAFTKEEKLEQMAQAQAVLLTLVHYAYALGMRRGKQGNAGRVEV